MKLTPKVLGANAPMFFRAYAVRFWHATCDAFGVAVRDFRDFVAWQLSYELKCEVFAFTAIGPAARDFKYRDQIRDSSASTHRNIAEGYGLYYPGEFARFCGYALGSLEETKSSLIDGRDRAYLDEKLFSRLWNLARAAERATKNLKFYLDSKSAKKNRGASIPKNPRVPQKKEP